MSEPLITVTAIPPGLGQSQTWITGEFRVWVPMNTWLSFQPPNNGDVTGEFTQSAVELIVRVEE